jgi:hypothetical protein
MGPAGSFSFCLWILGKVLNIYMNAATWALQSKHLSWTCRCSICLAHYSSPEILCRIPTCGHIFHVACLDSWLQQHRSCPLCKISVQSTIGVSLADPVTARSGATTSEAPSLTNSTIQLSSKSSDTHSRELWQSSPSPITSSDNQPLLVTIDPNPSQVDASSVDTTR